MHLRFAAEGWQAGATIVAMSNLSSERLNVLFVCSRNQTLHVLDVPDDYRYMDPELVALLGDPVAELLGLQRAPL